MSRDLKDGEKAVMRKVFRAERIACEKDQRQERAWSFWGPWRRLLWLEWRVRGHGAREVMGPQCRTLSDVVRAMGVLEGFEQGLL